MPVLFTAEDDVFRMSHVVDVMINPVNIMGAMGKGVAKEFKVRHPDMFNRYVEMCDTNQLQIGRLQVFKPERCRYTIINLPTKAHYIDDSDPEYIRKGLMALRRWLEKEGNHKLTVGMPMLGCGYGNLEQESVKPIFEECLGDLPNVVCVTQRPASFPTLPKFLVIFGPRAFASEKYKGIPNPMYKEQVAYMDKKITEALTTWGLTIDDFQAVMSGGAVGVDTTACGSSISSPSYQTSLIMKRVGDKPIKVVVAEADWDRNGPKKAGWMRNEFMADVGTHFIGFLPPNVPTVGTEMMIGQVTSLNNKDLTPSDPLYKHLLVYGDDLDASKKRSIKL